MSAIQFSVEVRAEFSIVKIEITRKGDDGRAIALPSDLKGMEAPKVDGKKGVVIDGAAPIWLHSALAHAYHPTAWVAHRDPRLGAVVVQSHVEGVSAGDVISL